MKILGSFLLTLGLMLLAFVLLHYLILWSGVNDLVALILFALPVCVFVAYATFDTPTQIRAAALRIFAWFVAMVVAAAALVELIG